MTKIRIVAFLLLVLLLAGCNLPVAPTGTPPPIRTSTPTVTQTLTPTATTHSQYPYIEVPLQAVLVSDDDGSYPVQIGPTQIQVWVDRANVIYAPAGIRFLFNPEETVEVQSTLLNNTAGNQDPAWDQEVAAGNTLAAAHPGRLMVIFRRGSGSNRLGGAFSSINYNFVVMPQFSQTWCNNQDDHGMLAHELGHYLGLGHIFGYIFHSEQEAAALLLAHNNNPQIFDADGLSDTLPDPYIDTTDIICGPTNEVTLNGIVFPLPRDNIMSYYNGRSSLSTQQMELARWYLQKRLQNGMAMPSNVNAPNALEAQDLGIWSSGCSSGYQDMTGFGDAHRWYNDDHLFVSSGANCSLTLSVPVTGAGRYRLDVYLTSTPDFGILQAYLDQVPVGDPIDLYTPSVMPTGPITLGTFDLTQASHTLTFKVIGKNALSPYYSMGVDCISLVPQP
jgi:hypothetical protein